jgi:hypothetical protein
VTRKRTGKITPTAVKEAKAALNSGLAERLAEVDTVPLDALASALPEERGQVVKVSPTDEIIATVRDIALGRYKGATPAREVVAAARLLCDFSIPRPAQEMHIKQAVINVIDAYSIPET